MSDEHVSVTIAALVFSSWTFQFQLLNVSVLVSRGRCHTGGILGLLEYLAALVDHQPLHAKHREQMVRSSWAFAQRLSSSVLAFLSWESMN